MQVLGGAAFFILFIAVGIAQLYAGFLGIEFHFGQIWAWAGVGVAIFLRVMLPLTIGSFFGAMDVWGWEWYWAALFAAPGLLFVVPAMVTSAIDGIRNR